MTKRKQALPKAVSQDEWQDAISELLIKEKEMTRLRDSLNAQRRRLPMLKVEKDYAFENENGKANLLELFEGRRQLIIYHFMFAPDWDEGCAGCSWVIDAMSHSSHLHARDTSLVLISRSPIEKITRYKVRMGWDIPWYSSFRSDFNFNFGATTNEGEEHGVSILLHEDDKIYRTYFTGARGVEHLGSHWTYLDLTPFGRQETWEDSPEGWPQTEPYEWQRCHNDYGNELS